MPFYFMSINFDESSFPADEGIELDDLLHAETEAVAVLLQLTRGRQLDATPRTLEATVCDDAGNCLSRISLSLTVERVAGPAASGTRP